MKMKLIIILVNNMSHEIDLSKYSVRTDLIIESIEPNSIKGLVKDKRFYDEIIVEDIVITKDSEKYCDKKKGKYITISFDDVTDSSNAKKLEEALVSELKGFIKYMNILKNDKCLVIGLGNASSTPDSLGPKVVDEVIVTRHLYELDGISVLDGYRNVSCLKPSVLALTGIETRDIIKGIMKNTKPDFVIVIDALASSSISRVNKTIQITDAGISPGSGIGNKREEISYESLGVPVIAVGIPTVVDAVTIVSDTINYIIKKISYSKKNFNSENDKLKPLTSINYLNTDLEDLTSGERKRLLGEIGVLSDEEIKQLIFEVLTPIGYNMMVTPKEVDFVIEKLARVVSNSINKSLHSNIVTID